MIDDSTKDLLASRLRTLAADYRLELMPLKFRQSMIDSADEIERLRMEIDDHFRARDTERLLSDNGDCPGQDNPANRDILTGDTPAAHATPGEGTSHGVCTLTDKERWAIEASIAYLQPVENYDNRVQTVLRKLLERL